MKHVDNEATVLMVQQSQSRWEIQTRNGYVIKGDIMISNAHDAEEYIKGYLSSFQCWNYQVIPLKKEVK